MISGFNVEKEKIISCVIALWKDRMVTYRIISSFVEEFSENVTLRINVKILKIQTPKILL